MVGYAKGMESLFAKQLVTSTFSKYNSMRCNLTGNTLEEYCRVSLIPRRANMQIGHSVIVPQSKGSAFQDFQGFAKPSRLLPAMEANIYSNNISEETFSSMELGESTSFYMVELCTSKDFGSGLKDLNAGILLCLIDEDGNSILQRISAASLQYPAQGTQMVFSESVYFQRGSLDIVTFKGSKLRKIEALWIGLESGSGSWRLDGIRLTTILGPVSLKPTDDMKESQFDGLRYEFEGNNVLLGEGGLSLSELRPILVTEISTDNLSTLLNWNSPGASLFTLNTSNEESMREYADLKFSLLLYDFLLIFTGSTLLIVSSNEEAAYSFLIGGIGGFIYLLLLQRSVDGLSSPSTVKADGEFGNIVPVLGEVKGPLLSLALALVTGAVAMKYGAGGSAMTLSPIDLFFGVAGFLVCKIAVVLAAFKPIERRVDEEA